MVKLVGRWSGFSSDERWIKGDNRKRKKERRKTEGGVGFLPGRDFLCDQILCK